MRENLKPKAALFNCANHCSVFRWRLINLRMLSSVITMTIIMTPFSMFGNSYFPCQELL